MRPPCSVRPGLAGRGHRLGEGGELNLQRGLVGFVVVRPEPPPQVSLRVDGDHRPVVPPLHVPIADKLPRLGRKIGGRAEEQDVFAARVQALEPGGEQQGVVVYGLGAVPGPDRPVLVVEVGVPEQHDGQGGRPAAHYVLVGPHVGIALHGIFARRIAEPGQRIRRRAEGVAARTAHGVREVGAAHHNMGHPRR